MPNGAPPSPPFVGPPGLAFGPGLFVERERAAGAVGPAGEFVQIGAQRRREEPQIVVPGLDRPKAFFAGVREAGRRRWVGVGTPVGALARGQWVTPGEGVARPRRTYGSGFGFGGRTLVIPNQLVGIGATVTSIGPPLPKDCLVTGATLITRSPAITVLVRLVLVEDGATPQQLSESLLGGGDLDNIRALNSPMFIPIGRRVTRAPVRACFWCNNTSGATVDLQVWVTISEAELVVG